MRTVKRFLATHKEALKAAWPFDFPYARGKRSPGAGQDKRTSQRGQIVFEFVLLLVLSISIATVVSKRMVSRDPENPGFLTGAWAKMSQAIGDDIME